MSDGTSKILDQVQIQQKVTRIAHQIIESHFNQKELKIVGIAKRGYTLSEKLAEEIARISKIKISHYKLTLDKKAPLGGTITLDAELSDLEGKCVVVVDDVVNSGRTLMHACRYLLQVPLKRLSTAVLVDREHRKFPVKSDFVGLTLSTTLQEHISVKFSGKQSTVMLS